MLAAERRYLRALQGLWFPEMLPLHGEECRRWIVTLRLALGRQRIRGFLAWRIIGEALAMRPVKGLFA